MKSLRTLDLKSALPIQLLTVALVMSACGAPKTDPQHLQISPVLSAMRVQSVEQKPNVTPCEFWSDLPSAYGLGRNVGETFQLFANLQLVESSEKAGSFYIIGRHNLKRLPQVLYKLSAEANRGIGKINAPTLAEFMILAEEANANGELSTLKFEALKAVYALSLMGNQTSTDYLIKTRNEKTIETIEKLLPGVFTGKAGPLKNDQLFLDLLKQSGINKNPEALYAPMKILQKEVPLFPSQNWRDRQKDAALELSILNRTAADKELPLTEKICRFAIAHRFQAQMLTLKGFYGSPKLQPSGLLADLPDNDWLMFPTEKHNGTFGIIVDEEWIKDQIAHPAARAENTDTTEDFLHALNYLSTVTSHRSPLLWSAHPEKSEPGTVTINIALLKLGMGFFGFTAQVLAKDELNLTVKDRISLRNDSPDNLALLGQVAMNISENFSPLKNPNSIENEILSPSQITSFLAPYPTGVVAKMDRLTLGVTFEGLGRIHAGEGSEDLKQAIRRVGHKTGNRALENLP